MSACTCVMYFDGVLNKDDVYIPGLYSESVYGRKVET